ncbi:maleylacetoacetate isomerase [Sphingomonas morindae]|uniref:Maleylacetoacetate isomerase n=1 Tax=Sphingomonas morindae TaxID=1541170 RepID=A0ABY4XDZ4_9SPHN|nr:maleylacetoacetate isomerase [Sphingomonas morindae]USI75128.1 maleylacetoacetate isomerase [Sphingomonas morindae]
MTLKLYGFWRSNAAFRVRVALALKALPYEEIDIDLLSGDQFDSAYAEINAGHVVPTLVHDDRQIFQSLAIIEYLDEIAPEPPLLPAEPFERAYTRSLAMVLAADVHPLTVPRVRQHLKDVLAADSSGIEAWCRHWTAEGLATYERLLLRRPPAPFALGEFISVGDIGIAGQVALAEVYHMDLSSYPQVEALAKRCFALSAFSDAHPFAQPGYRAKNPR